MTMTMTHSDKVFTRGSTLPYGLEWGSRGLIEKSVKLLVTGTKCAGREISACESTSRYSHTCSKEQKLRILECTINLTRFSFQPRLEHAQDLVLLLVLLRGVQGWILQIHVVLVGDQVPCIQALVSDVVSVIQVLLHAVDTLLQVDLFLLRF